VFSAAFFKDAPFDPFSMVHRSADLRLLSSKSLKIAVRTYSYIATSPPPLWPLVPRCVARVRAPVSALFARVFALHLRSLSYGINAMIYGFSAPVSIFKSAIFHSTFHRKKRKNSFANSSETPLGPEEKYVCR
jgi:hypothetical protein